jgi:hypothetical protein
LYVIVFTIEKLPLKLHCTQIHLCFLLVLSCFLFLYLDRLYMQIFVVCLVWWMDLDTLSKRFSSCSNTISYEDSFAQWFHHYHFWSSLFLRIYSWTIVSSLLVRQSM